jgi:crotonobetainyl-CoA:carnitine CoA-transferase CaiB-like acyl-CoA transferase
VQKITDQGIHAGPINNIDGPLADPQIQARGMLADVEGRQFVRTPIKSRKRR